MAQEVPRPDLFVLNGDTCDGVNKKSEGNNMWTTNRRVQAETMVALAEMVKARQYAGTLGSFYHVEDNMSADEYVIDKLNGTFRTALKFTAEGVRFHISHEVGFSKNWHTRYTSLGGELQAAYLNNKTYRPYKLIVRSHVHYHVMATMSDGETVKTAFTTPCWKLRDEYAEKRGLTMAPHIGYVLVTVDGDKMNIKPRLFTRPVEESDVDDLVLT